MYTGKEVSFNSFSANSVSELAVSIAEWYESNGKDYEILNVSYSVAYKGKDEKGREQFYHGAIVTHGQH